MRYGLLGCARDVVARQPRRGGGPEAAMGVVPEQGQRLRQRPDGWRAARPSSTPTGRRRRTGRSPCAVAATPTSTRASPSAPSRITTRRCGSLPMAAGIFVNRGIAYESTWPVRPRHPGLRPGAASEPGLRRGPLLPWRGLARKGPTPTARSRTTIRRCGSTPRWPMPSSAAAWSTLTVGPGRPRHQGLRPGASPEPQIRAGLQQPGLRLLARGQIRPRHRGLRPGDPARPEQQQGLQQPRACLAPQGPGRPRHPGLRSGDPPQSVVLLGFRNCGWAYSALGQYDRAIEDIDQALRLKPDDADLLGNRCYAKAGAGALAAALADGNEALRRMPGELGKSSRAGPSPT